MVIIVCFYGNIKAQESSVRTFRQSAIETYNRGQYEKAFRQFSELLSMFPRDPLYKYYAGVCLVKLEREPATAASFLKEASEGSGTIKPVPSDVWFWRGRAQHLAGMFSEAVASYERFTELAGKKSAREMNVPEYIRQCNERKGNITGFISQGKVIPFNNELIAKDTEKQPVDDTAPVKEAIPESVKREKEYAPAEVDTLLSRLLAGKLMDSVIKAKESVTKPATGTVQKAIVKDESKPSGKPVPSKDVSKEISKTATGSPVSKLTAIPAESRSPVFSQFEIIKKPVYKPDEKIPLNPDIPPGLIYRIQVAIFRNPVSPSYFKGLTPLQAFRNTGSDLTVYYAGMFRRAADALAALLKVRALGFKDAFVVALMDKKQVTMERAKMLEKEWGLKPLFEITSMIAERDTIPPALVFRVEVMKTQKPLNENQTGELRKLAGNRGLDILSDEKKQNIYLIGIFLSYNSASEYTDLLVRNGYRDAKVVAYLGMKEIPVDIARKLFEEY